jgi:hypothetical protein
MVSKEGETLNLFMAIDTIGVAPEKWLKELENQMILTIKLNTLLSFQSYQCQDLQEWLS